MTDYVSTAEMARRAGERMGSMARAVGPHFDPARDLGDPVSLEQAIAQRNGWCQSAMMFSKNEDYYRGLVEQIGAMLGQDAFTADDGVVHDSVLCAKVPELVRGLLTELDDIEEDLMESQVPPPPEPSFFERVWGAVRWQWIMRYERRDSAFRWVARRLPRRLRYFAMIQEGADHSVLHPTVEVPAMRFMDVVQGRGALL